ncbi:unnamed protein product [Onchocerca flexuosa]|uniref:UBX domain-containing protein n=1 Tax=Onchocerca flexuosa TaxID=387005 RepID=A0A183I296_9BILA|nr:unnamed protein product [Onchocerca flexuosa]
MKISPIKTEYKYQKVSDERDDVYPTRGLYPRPEESRMHRLEQELEEMILSYNSCDTKNEMTISLVFTEKIVEEENTEKELQIEISDAQRKAVVDFMQLHILNTPCAKLLLPEKYRMDQLKYMQKDYSINENTIITIVEGLFKDVMHQ